MAAHVQAALSAGVGEQMYALIGELYPICRSITGRGFRDSLRVLSRYLPIELHEVPSGTQVLDWTVPKEWNIRRAYVKDPAGRTIVDFRNSNLHVVSYSVPVHRRLPLRELRQHLFTLPDQPDLIPYRTSYYREDWGFCVPHRLLASLEAGDYEVCIDSTLAPGSLCYGEYLLRGRTEDEVVISCHCCHPSLCNDNLSGMALSTFLAQKLQGAGTRYSYRFLFLPGTIGAITWLALHAGHTAKIRHGLVVACVGDRGHLTYKKSRQGKAEIDQAAIHVLNRRGVPYDIEEFAPVGYDERQYCSPGFNLPFGRLTRTPPNRFPEYHTSADDLNLVDPAALADSLEACGAILGVLEHDHRYRNLCPRGEPQLGRRGLYGPVGGRSSVGVNEEALLWVLNLSDGSCSLLDIAERAGLDFETIREAAEALERHNLLEKV
jgi:aminopeptidase-like protein